MVRARLHPRFSEREIIDGTRWEPPRVTFPDVLSAFGCRFPIVGNTSPGDIPLDVRPSLDSDFSWDLPARAGFETPLFLSTCSRTNVCSAGFCFTDDVWRIRIPSIIRTRTSDPSILTENGTGRQAQRRIIWYGSSTTEIGYFSTDIRKSLDGVQKQYWHDRDSFFIYLSYFSTKSIKRSAKFTKICIPQLASVYFNAINPCYYHRKKSINFFFFFF